MKNGYQVKAKTASTVCPFSGETLTVNLICYLDASYSDII